MSISRPAVSLAAVPGRRLATVELAQKLEASGFAGIYCASFGDAMALSEAIALRTERIRFGTSIQPIYTRHVSEFAQHASWIHEISGGRFSFGIGVSHAPLMKRLGVHTGKPLSDMRQFVADLRAVPRAGELPPIVLAAMRTRMVQLAGEIAQGLVFANAARSHVKTSLAALPPAARENPDFYIGCMTPTCICDDVEAARAVNRKTLSGYAMLPNYRAYWKEAGYVEEMEAVEKALEAGERARIPELLSDRWLADTTISGPAAHVREQVEAWREAGVRTPILVPSSASGGQFDAFAELMAIYA